MTELIIIGQTANTNRPTKLTPLNGSHFICIFNFQKAQSHLRWKTPSNACQRHVLGLHLNLSCLLPSAPSSFFANHIFSDTVCTSYGGLHVLQDLRERRRWGERKEKCTLKPPEV